MGFKSLSGNTGYLLVGTTGVRLTANLVGVNGFVAGAKYTSHTIYIQQHEDNDAMLYLMDRSTANGGNPLTGVGVLAKLVAPFTVSGSLTGLAWVAVTIPYAPGGLNASDYYLVSTSPNQLAGVSVVSA